MVASGTVTQGPPSAVNALTSDLRPPSHFQGVVNFTLSSYLPDTVEHLYSKMVAFKLYRSRSHTFLDSSVWPLVMYENGEEELAYEGHLIDRRGREVQMILRSLSVQAVNPQTFIKLKMYSLLFRTKNLFMCIQLGTTPPLST